MNDKKMQGYRLVVEPSGKKKNRSRSRSNSKRKNRFHGRRYIFINLVILHHNHLIHHPQEAQVLVLHQDHQSHHHQLVIHIAIIHKK